MRKKWCGDCKAFKEDSDFCLLGFKTALEKMTLCNGDYILMRRSAEKCPKPRTFKKYIELHNEMMTNRSEEHD